MTKMTTVTVVMTNASSTYLYCGLEKINVKTNIKRLEHDTKTEIMSLR